MPAIKGDMYINTHCNYSQPALIKFDNENIGGHLTPLHSGHAYSLVWLRADLLSFFCAWGQRRVKRSRLKPSHLQQQPHQQPSSI